MMKRVLSVVFAAALLFGLLSVIPVAANATTGMTVSDACVETIKQMEGFVAIPRWDYSQWTVGFGSRCPDEDLERYQKTGIPMDEADALMRKHLQSFEKSVNSYIARNNLTLNQAQFDALVSMTYNLGTAFLYNENNRANRAILDGASENRLIFGFSVHCTAGGEFLPGLIRRRLVEANMFLNGEYDDYAPDNYCYVLYDANGGVRDVRAQGYDCNLWAEPWSVPTYDGHTFVGWYTAATGGVRVTSLNESHDGMTLYAHWAEGESKPDGSALPEGGLEVTVTAAAVNVRNGAGTDYAIVDGVFENEKITITGTTTEDGIRWGRFEKGWIPLKYTNYAELTGDYDETVGGSTGTETIQVPVRATVLNSSGVTVYNGPHTTYPKVTTLSAGTEIEITETYTLYNVNWGKCQQGWVQINLKLQLHDDQRLVHPFDATVDYSYLNVRSGPGTNYSRTSSLKKGEVVQIVAIAYAEDAPWGRFSSGWISLEYTDFDESLMEQYRAHSYGQWYESIAATCVTAGQERRDCQYCEDYESRVTTAGGHSFGQWYETVAATCVTPGVLCRDCANCGEVETVSTELGNHSYGNWYETVASTCVAAGQERRDCIHCDEFETRETALTGHSFGQWYEAVAATCVTAGQERRDCIHCDQFETRQTELTGHSFGQWYETVAATCIAPGQERRDCANCDTSETREMAQLEHNYEAWVTYMESTCAVAGEERRVCADCGAYESRALPLAEHSFGLWQETLAPTVDTAGEERRDCENCDYFETRAIEPTEHIYGDWYEVLAPTCTQVGLQQRDCQHCELKQVRETPATGHTMGDWSEITAPDCQTEGQQRRACEKCDYVETAAVPALGHQFDEWIELEPVTCTQDGKRCRVCIVCAHLQVEDVVSAGHPYSNWIIAVEPTCTENGERFRVCPVCGDNQQETIVAGGHSFGDWVATTPAACGQAGEERRDCANCDVFEVRTIEAVDHAYSEWSVIRYPTCEQMGEMCRICSACGYKETQNVEPMGHKFGAWNVYISATCGQAGEERRACDYCGTIETRSIDALKHSFGQWYVYKEAACGVDGEARRDCEHCEQYETLLIEGTEHVFEAWFVVIKPSCETAGEQWRECANCSFAEKREVAATGHSFGAWYVAVEPTVTSEGEDRRDCEICGAYESRTTARLEGTITKVYGTVTGYSIYIRAGAGSSYAYKGAVFFGDRVEILEQTTLSTGVVWGRIGEKQWVELTKMKLETVQEAPEQTIIKVYATVLSDQLHVYSAVDSDTVVDTLQKSQVVLILEQKEVNGVNWGKTDAGWICLTDNTTLDVQTSVVGGPSQWNPTIQGTVTASVLNVRNEPGNSNEIVATLSKRDVIQILEMKIVSWGVWGRIEQGWVRVDGYMKLEMITDEQTPEHSFGEWYVELAATCTTAGQRRRDCSHCDEYETEVIAATGHTFGNWFAVQDGNCTTDTEEARICSSCGEVEFQTVKATGHSFGDWTVIREGNCTTPAEEKRTCSVCGLEETRSSEAAGHALGNWEVTQEGSCTTKQEEARVCSICGYVETRTSEAVGHAYGDWSVAREPDCANVGLEVRICGNCTYTEIRELAATGHVFGDWYEAKAPTVQTEGQARRDCTVCGTYELRTIDKLPGTDVPVTKLYATVTSTSLSIRDGAGTSYTKLGKLPHGGTVELLEIVTVGSNSWGRCADGWICLTGYTVLKTAEVEADATENIQIQATTTTKLSIRLGAGTGYTRLGYLSQGSVVDILEIVAVGEASWGRYADGWICLTGYTTLTASSQAPGSSGDNTQPGIEMEFAGGVPDAWFENVLFIGDSRFVGLQTYARSGNADYFCDVGMSLFNYSGKVLSDSNFTDLTLIQLLATRSYDKIIFNFGLNEAGYPQSTLISKYKSLIKTVQTYQPDAILIINGIMSVSAKKAAQASYFEPAHLATLSQAIEALCDGKTIYYIDCNEYFTDDEGYLLSAYSKDGYHPTVNGYCRWKLWMAYAIAQLGV